MMPDELLDNTKNLIYKIALKFKHICEIEDAYQAGVIGLMKAYKNYNKESNAEFTSYAYMYIYGEILSAIRDNRAIKISNDYYKIYKTYEKTKDFLTSKLNREPSIIEISKFMNIDIAYLNNVIVSCAFTSSINAENNEEEYSLLDKIGEDKTSRIDRLLDLKEALSKLKDQERKLIDLRYFKDYTQMQTAKELNMSQVEVSREEKKILKKINHEMTV